MDVRRNLTPFFARDRTDRTDETAIPPVQQGALEGVGSTREESVKLLVLALCPEGFVRPPASTSAGKVHP